MFDLERLKGLEGKNRTEQINVLGDYLEERGIEPVISESSYGLKSAYYVGKDAVLAIVHKPASDDLDFVLMDRVIYDNFLADKRGSLNLVKRDRKSDYKVMISRDGGKKTLHREVMKLVYGDSIEGKQVDHITHNTLINTRDFLRPCTGSQNIQNRVTSKKRAKVMTGDILATDYMSDFAYNPVLDFTDTWYAVVLYKMDCLSSKRLCNYNRDYMMRHDRMTA